MFFEDINVGDEIPSLTKKITLLKLVMYSAATWDFHRLHYDIELARSKGLPNPFLDGPHLGAFLAQMLVDWMGIEGALRKLSFKFRQMVFPGDTVTCMGKVSKKYIKDGKNVIECELWVKNQKGELVVSPSSVTISLPQRT